MKKPRSRRAADRRRRHLPYFEVLDALRQAETCPLCDLEFRGTQGYLKSLLYEFVNDPGIRESLIRSKGFCHRHGHMLLRFADGLGISLLYQDQLKLLLKFLEKTAATATRRSRRDAAVRWAKRGVCAACRVQTEHRRRWINVLAEGLSDPEMRAALEGGAALCVPHFLNLLEGIADADARSAVVEVQRRKCEELLGDLQEFCRKQDYRFRHEPPGRERDAWRRAVNMMVGHEQVF